MFSRSASRTTRSRLRRNCGSCGGSSTRRAATRDRKSSITLRSPNDDRTSQCGATGPRYTTWACARGGSTSGVVSVSDMARHLSGPDLVTRPRAGPGPPRARPRARPLGAPAAEGGGDGLLLALALDAQLDLLAGLALAHQAGHGGGRLDGLAVELEDDVAVLDAGLRGPAARRDLGDERPLVGLDAELLADRVVDPVEVDGLDAQERGVGGDLAAAVAEVVDQRLHRVDRDGE